MSDIIGAAKPGLVNIDGRPIPKVGAASELPIEERAKQLVAILVMLQVSTKVLHTINNTTRSGTVYKVVPLISLRA